MNIWLRKTIPRGRLWASELKTHAQSRRMMSVEWRFAPLKSMAEDAAVSKPKLDGIVFDVDGTLCEPQNYMFKEMRDALGIDKSIDILDHVHSLSGADQEEAHEKIRAIERRAMKVQKPQPGLQELMEYLDSRQIQKGICTRNFDEPVTHLLNAFIPETKMWPVITRAFHPPKPDPAGILHIAESWSLPKEERGTKLIMVGDSVDDMTAGFAAGAVTVLLVSEANEHLVKHEWTTTCIHRLDELIPILENGTVE